MVYWPVVANPVLEVWTNSCLPCDLVSIIAASLLAVVLWIVLFLCGLWHSFHALSYLSRMLVSVLWAAISNDYTMIINHVLKFALCSEPSMLCSIVTNCLTHYMTTLNSKQHIVALQPSHSYGVFHVFGSIQTCHSCLSSDSLVI